MNQSSCLCQKKDKYQYQTCEFLINPLSLYNAKITHFILHIKEQRLVPTIVFFAY